MHVTDYTLRIHDTRTGTVYKIMYTDTHLALIIHIIHHLRDNPFPNIEIEKSVKSYATSFTSLSKEQYEKESLPRYFIIDKRAQSSSNIICSGHAISTVEA